MQNRAQAECAVGHAEQAFTPAQHGDNGVEKAQRIESDGDAKPKETGFAHEGCSFPV